MESYLLILFVDWYQIYTIIKGDKMINVRFAGILIRITTEIQSHACGRQEHKGVL
jgi:hypothetical protein